MADNTCIKKICIVGDTGVGKTSMVSRYITGKYTNNYTRTITMDLFSQQINVNKNKLILQIWDIAGVDMYGIINKMYLMGANMYIIAFDLSRKESFNNIDNWLSLLKIYPEVDIPVILVGLKSDIAYHEVTADDINNYASTGKILQYFEISSKTSYNIDSMFEYIVEYIGTRHSLNMLTEPLITQHDINDTDKTCNCVCPTGCNIL